MNMYALIFMSITLNACQGYRYVPFPNPLPTDIDQLEYASLQRACKLIRLQQIAAPWKDETVTNRDAVEHAITMFLKHVNNKAAHQLLKDLRSNNFRLGVS